jgi:palmitoyltransferase
MFTRASFSEIQTKSFNQNIKPSEFFDYIQQKNHDKIKEYFSNPDYKVWLLKDENGYTMLHKSVFNNDIETTEIIIKEAKRRLGMGKGDALAKFINDKNNDGLTALHFAANKGNIPLLKLLIDNGANVDAVTNLGKNVMHMAAEGNQPSMLIYLITEEHQSSQSVDESGSTPLHWACYAGAEEAVNFLLNLNVDINEQDKEKLTPLHLATNEGRENIVLKLLQKNADKNIPNNKGELPIDLARKKNHKRIEQILGEDDFNPLCSLELPKYYIQPKDIYKKIIILMIVIPEVVIYFFILPYLYGYHQSLINVPAFIFTLLFYFIFIGVDPGYRKNTEMEEKANGKYPLILKVNDGVDVRNYCPKCFVQKSYNITHCFICDKCVVDMSHHCFWINKCIARKNRGLYITFIVFALIYANHALFICLELLWDDVNLPYDHKLIHLYLFEKYKGFRVLGASVAGVFSLIVGLPLWFLILIESLKACGLFGKKKNTIENQLQEIILNTNEKNPDTLMTSTMVELQEEKKEFLIDEEEDNEKDLLLNGDDNNININTVAINDEEPEKTTLNSNILEDKKENNEVNVDEDNKIQLIENVEDKNDEEEVKEEEQHEEINNNQEIEDNQNQEEAKEEPQQEVNKEPQQEVNEEPQQEVNEEPQQEGNEEPQQGVNEEPQQEVNEKPQQEVNEEEQPQENNAEEQNNEEEKKEEVNEEPQNKENNEEQKQEEEEGDDGS